MKTEQRIRQEVFEECAQLVERCMGLGQFRLVGHGIAEVIRQAGATPKSAVPVMETGVGIEEMAAAIVTFWRHAGDVHVKEALAVDAVTRLVALGNRLRPAGKTCEDQNEDYPGMFCTRKSGHKGRHAKPTSGATW